MTPTIYKHIFENLMVPNSSHGGIYVPTQVGAACKTVFPLLTVFEMQQNSRCLAFLSLIASC